MKPVLIPLFLSADTAILHNQTKYGDVEVEPTAAQLASLSPEDKDTLIYLVNRGWNVRLVVKSLEWPSIHEAISQRTQERKAEAEEKARLEAAVDALARDLVAYALKQPDAVWDEQHPVMPLLEGTWGVPFDRQFQARNRASEHPEVKARLKASNERVEAKKRQANEERLRLQAAEEKAAEEKAKRWDEDLRAFAAGIDEFARAATEGYPIERQVLRHILTKIAGPLSHEVVEYDFFKDRMKPYTRPAPDKLAFSVLDRVKAAAREAKTPQGVELDILPIQRVRRQDEASVTVVAVELSHPGKTPDLVLVVPAESDE